MKRPDFICFSRSACVSAIETPIGEQVNRAMKLKFRTQTTVIYREYSPPITSMARESLDLKQLCYKLVLSHAMERILSRYRFQGVCILENEI